MMSFLITVKLGTLLTNHQSMLGDLIIKWEGVKHPILPNLNRYLRINLANIHIMSTHKIHICIKTF